MMMIDNKYNFGDIVYLATDECQLPRMVTAITIRNGLMVYELSCGSMTATWHTEIEMTIEKQVLNVL